MLQCTSNTKARETKSKRRAKVLLVTLKRQTVKSAKPRVVSFPICPLVNMHYDILSYMVKLDFPTTRFRKQRQMFSF